MRLMEPIIVERNCQGVRIPEGTTTSLPAGTIVTLHQALGGDYTVRTGCGEMIRISGKDADAIGMQPTVRPETASGPFDVENVWEQLRSVYDPEIPVNIVELGLVYECDAEPLPGGGHRVDIQMTLTAPGCGMGEVLKRDVEQKVLSVPDVKVCNVELVWEPQWGPDRMSEAARLQLGFF